MCGVCGCCLGVVCVWGGVGITTKTPLKILLVSDFGTEIKGCLMLQSES